VRGRLPCPRPFALRATAMTDARDTDLCEAQKVLGYPALRLYADGQMVEQYSGAFSSPPLP
jgi:hypothetical protein